MEKRIFLKSARAKTIDSHNSIDSIKYTRATQKIANIHTTHKGKNNSTDGAARRARSARPIGIVVGARAARAPLCVV